MMFKKVLVPLDGSTSSQRALEIAVAIARKFQSKITLLYVNSLNTIISLDTYDRTQVLTTDEITKRINTTREAGFTLLTQTKKTVKAQGIPVNTRFKEGHFVQHIVNTAQEGGFHLIVMGARGVNAMKDTRLESVNERVLRKAPCNVMVSK
jgi:nucleotide-binding universal stress UspA family protein